MNLFHGFIFLSLLTAAAVVAVTAEDQSISLKTREAKVAWWESVKGAAKLGNTRIERDLGEWTKAALASLGEALDKAKPWILLGRPLAPPPYDADLKAPRPREEQSAPFTFRPDDVSSRAPRSIDCEKPDDCTGTCAFLHRLECLGNFTAKFCRTVNHLEYGRKLCKKMLGENWARHWAKEEIQTGDSVSSTDARDRRSSGSQTGNKSSGSSGKRRVWHSRYGLSYEPPSRQNKN